MTTPCPVHARAEDLLRDLHLVPWEAQGRVRVEKAPFCQLSQALGSHRGCWSTKGLKAEPAEAGQGLGKTLEYTSQEKLRPDSSVSLSIQLTVKPSLRQLGKWNMDWGFKH